MRFGGQQASTIHDWGQAREFIQEAIPGISVRGEFGYYGESSTCMPRLYTTPKDQTWEYSSLLITINFLMFFYMAIAYIIIYRKSNCMRSSKSIDRSSALQRRIFRLVFTDFCCWIPVCIMGFLSMRGINIPPEACDFTACILLPINSALNPLLYSTTISNAIGRGKRASIFNFISKFKTRATVSRV